jgi:YHS domain-containing protein
MIRSIARFVALSFVCSIAPQLPAQEMEAKPALPAPALERTDGYPLDTCIVSGRPLGEGQASVVVEGRTYKTCCDKCPAKIEKDPATYAAKLDAAIFAAEQANYPVDTCVISGKKLDSMGGPKAIVLGNHLVQLCCGNCTKKAQAKQQEILAMLETKALEKQRADYPSTTCPVSGHDFEPKEAVEILHGNTLVRLCCDDCIDDFKKKPNEFVAKIQAARQAKTAPAEGSAKKGAEPAGEPAKQDPKK